MLQIPQLRLGKNSSIQSALAVHIARFMAFGSFGCVPHHIIVWILYWAGIAWQRQKTSNFLQFEKPRGREETDATRQQWNQISFALVPRAQIVNQRTGRDTNYQQLNGDVDSLWLVSIQLIALRPQKKQKNQTCQRIVLVAAHIAACFFFFFSIFFSFGNVDRFSIFYNSCT